MVYDPGYRSSDIPGDISRISADIRGQLPQNSKTTKFSPTKAEKKTKKRPPSPSSARITIDLTAEEEYASFPWTQLTEREPSTYELNEKESIVYGVRSTVLVYGQPRQHLPRPQSVRICHSFHHRLPGPCLKSDPKKRVKKEVQVKKEMQCYRCDYPIKKNACGCQRPS